MSPSKFYQDKDWLCARVREGRSPKEIANICGVTEPTINRWVEKHEITPYRDEDWLANQIDQFVSERAIADWCGVTEQTVKRWMNKFEIEHPGLASAQVMQSFLKERFEDLDDISNKTQIAILWQRHHCRVQYAEIARAVGTTPEYVRKVVGVESRGDIGQIIDSMEFLGSESIPEDIAKEVKVRDDESCIRCGSARDIEIHHIIPGESTPDNLAILCRDCHSDAHAGGFYNSELAYKTRKEFWDVWIEEH